jgi:hypothetical protein
MRGEFGYSLQLNALTIPLLFLILLGQSLPWGNSCEARHRLHGTLYAEGLMRKWPIALILLLAWWGFHLATALRSSNAELIDPGKPIAACLHALLQP